MRTKSQKNSLIFSFFVVFHFVLSVANAAGPNKRFSAYQYGLLPVLAVGNIILNFTPAPVEPHWQGGILADDWARNSLRASEKGTRSTVATIGDVMVGALSVYPFAVDALGDSWLSNGDPDTAAQVSLIAAEGLLLSSFLRVLTKVLVGRERPLQQECAADPNYDADCGTGSSRSSFFSGHAAFSFTGAGLICSAHEALPLSGGSIPCYVGLGAATAVSLTRIIADKHYLSDTLVGAAIGIFSGYFLPKWINYEGSTSSVEMAPSVTDQGVNLTLMLPW